METRESVRAGWLGAAQVLRAQGYKDLTAEVESFARSMPPARTDKESVAAGLLAQLYLQRQKWAAAGFVDTLLRWQMKPEVVYGNEAAIQPGVQA